MTQDFKMAQDFKMTQDFKITKDVEAEKALLCTNTATSAEEPTTKKQSHKRLAELQGLRGLAILAVLLFHLWPDQFRTGFLGVDIFFVISGYLMCMLLSRHQNLDFKAISDFYFRRLKRIFPTYLFVILLTLISGYLLICPSDYSQLFHETIRPLLVAANVPRLTNQNYFEQTQGTYSFFHHLWSLSVELQFYAFVPFLVYVLGYLSYSLKLVTVLLIGAISFFYQLHSTADYEHMALCSRVWQFMCGFLAHYLSRFFDSNQLELQFGALNKGHSVIGLVLPLLLFFSTLIEISPYKQLNRLFATSLSVIIISKHTDCWPLNWSLLTLLGDISYSVYLVHWPLLEWYKYTNVELFVFGEGTTVAGGILLFLASVAVGQLVEELFGRLNRLLVSWKTLLTVIFILYTLIFGTMYRLRRDAVIFEPSKYIHRILPDLERVQQKALHFYLNSAEHLTKEESIEWTMKFHYASFNPIRCDSSIVPTNFSDIKAMGRLGQLACIVRGNGTKTFVLFGNSHAKAYFPGVVHHFRNEFKELALIKASGCNFVGSRPDDVSASLCLKERRAILPILRQWKNPIDVIVFAQAYMNQIDYPLELPLEKDSIYQEMSAFFNDLSEIARELVMIPTVQFDNGFRTYSKILIRKLIFEEDLKVFRTPIEYVREHRINTRRRVAAVECKRCLKFDLADVWCKENLCRSVDEERRVGYFFDRHHMNIYGSLFAGEHFRRIYDDWMLNRNLSFVNKLS